MMQSPQRKTLDADVGGVRLDLYLAEVLSGTTRSQVQKSIQDGKVTVNGITQRPSFLINKGDRIEMLISQPEVTSLEPEDIPVEVVYEDEDLAVVNKPAGLSMYPGPGHSSHTLVNAILKRFPDIEDPLNPQRPGIVHRLDKDTSGLVVIAKNEKARQYLINEFKSRLVKKAYLILVRGKLLPEKGAIEAPIGRHPTDRKRMAVVSKGKDARTDYRVIQYFDGYSLVEAYIKTGRTHQIRVHFSAIGYPVVGDRTYGISTRLIDRQFLHACFLELVLPSTGLPRSFHAGLPGDLKKVIKELERK